MEVKGALSSAVTILLGLVCVALGALLLTRLWFIADLDKVELDKETGVSHSEEERKSDEENDYHSQVGEGVTGLFDYHTDPLTEDDCIRGTCPTTGANSCLEIQRMGLPSGHYWMNMDNGSTIQRFCNMRRSGCDIVGGWTRIALLNMSDPTHNCPNQWREITSPKRTCGRTNRQTDTGGHEEEEANGAGCSSAIFNTYGQQYRHVCGRILGYQYCNTLAFWSYFHNEDEMTIDGAFVDGVTISHGTSPRQHVWTLASALHENYEGRDTICQCTRKNYDNNSYRRVKVPPWVGTSYFCETGTASQPPATTEECFQVHESAFYSKDPLWDGQGCGSNSNCCKFHQPPWFCKELPEPTRDDLEVRICGSAYTSFGDTPVELVELYIH